MTPAQVSGGVTTQMVITAQGRDISSRPGHRISWRREASADAPADNENRSASPRRAENPAAEIPHWIAPTPTNHVVCARAQENPSRLSERGRLIR
jgi:hypothetical protein